MKTTIRVLMVGSNTKVKGGMTTVVKSFLAHPFSEPIELKYIPTHSEKGIVYNSSYFAVKLLAVLFDLLFRNPQIVHLHMSDKGSFVRKYIVYKLSKMLGKKVIVHMHGGDFESFYAGMPELLKRRIHDLLKHADKVVALGSNWERTLLAIEPGADIAVLPNSVPIPLIDGSEPDDEVFTVLFLAVLNESKGILDLIRASKNVVGWAEAAGRKLRFEIAGDGEMMAEARELVAASGLSRQYKFHGWVDGGQKEQLLRKSDLFVLPSYFEGLPMSVLEAISWGLPVIATTVGSIDEAVKEGMNGYLIEPGDIEGLEDRLYTALTHPHFERMREASRALAEEKFDEQKYFGQMEVFYHELMVSGKGTVENLQ